MLVCVTIATVAALLTRGLNPLIALDHVLRQAIKLDVLWRLLWLIRGVIILLTLPNLACSNLARDSLSHQGREAQGVTKALASGGGGSSGQAVEVT